MKINSITLENFKSFGSVSIEDLQKVNWFFGDNSTGKTSMLQAMKLFFTLDNSPEYIRSGEQRFAISCEIRDFGKIEYFQGSDSIVKCNDNNVTKSVFREILESKLKEASVMAAAIDSAGFLNLDPEKKQEVLFKLIKVVIGKGTIQDEFNKWCEENKKNALIGLDIQGSGFNEIKRIYEAAYNTRRDANRELKQLKEPDEIEVNAKVQLPGGKEKVLTVADKENIEENLKGLRNERDEIISQLGQAEVKKPKSKKTVKQIQEEIDAEYETAHEINEELDSVAKALARAEARREALDKMLEKVKEGSCPILDEECERIKSESSKLKKEKTNIEKQIPAIEKQRAKFNKKKDESESKVLALSAEKKEVEEFAESADNPVANRKELEKNKEELEQRIEKGESMLAIIHKLEAAGNRDKAKEEYAKRKKEIEENIVASQIICDAFKSDIKNRILETALKPFLEELNSSLKLIAGDGYQVSIDYSDKLEFMAGRGKLRPLELLSASEVTRVGLALQDAMNSLSNIGLLCVDQADILVGSNRETLVKSIYKLKEKYDTIFVMASSTEKEVQNSPLIKTPDTAVFFLKGTDSGTEVRRL